MATEEFVDTRSPAGTTALSAPASDVSLPVPAQRALTFGILLSACRCTLQYVLLPFVLPWIGVAAAIPTWLTMALGVLALGALARNVRMLWRMRHARRWSYLMLAGVVAASLLLFTVVDLHRLVGL